MSARVVIAILVVLVLSMTVIIQSKPSRSADPEITQVDLLDSTSRLEREPTKVAPLNNDPPVELLTPNSFDQGSDESLEPLELDDHSDDRSGADEPSEALELVTPWIEGPPVARSSMSADALAVNRAAEAIAPEADTPGRDLLSASTGTPTIETPAPHDVAAMANANPEPSPNEGPMTAASVAMHSQEAPAESWASEVSNEFAMASTLDEPLTTEPYVAPVVDQEEVVLDEPEETAREESQPATTMADHSAVNTPAEPLRDIPTSVAQVAREHLRYGNSLARRGSLFSARQEFFAGLRLISESLDLVNQSAAHREHFSMAMTAMNEASDFTASPGDQVSTPIHEIVSLHQSKILSESEMATVTPMAAMQAYFIHAEEHFSKACGHSPVASELLFGLGKLHTVKAALDPSAQPTDLAIAILMHHAALNVDPRNYLSANELGVALAKLRHYEAARTALLHSLSTQPTPEAWLNLSIVHRALGETQLADLALVEHKTKLAERARGSELSPSVQWMEPADFAATQQVAYEAPAFGTPSAPAAPVNRRIESSVPADQGMWSQIKKSFGAR